MYRIVRLGLMASLALLVLSLAAAPAFGAPADTSTSRYEVQFWPEGDVASSVLIVSITLPEGTALPTTVRLPLPVGAQVTWAGEIMGGAIDNDILRPHQFVQGVGGQSVEMTLEQTLTAQYDASYLPVDANGGDYSIALDWTQSEPSDSTDFSVRLPGTVADIEIDPATVGGPQVNTGGERLYSLSPISLEPGENQVLSVAYARPELGGGTSDGSTVLPWLLGALALAIIVLVLAIARRNRMSSAEEE